MAAQHRIKEDEELNITHVVILLLIKLKFMKINKKALSTGKSSFLRIIAALVQVRSGFCGITILQFFRSTGEHDCLWFKQRLSWSG